MAKHYDRLRSAMEHEDGLFNQRTAWLLAAQAFLLFPFLMVQEARVLKAPSQSTVVDANKKPVVADEAVQSYQKFLLAADTCIFLFAASFAVFTASGQAAAAHAVVTLEKDYCVLGKPDGPPTLYPRSGFETFGILPVVVPELFLVLWSTLYLMSSGPSPNPDAVAWTKFAFFIGIWLLYTVFGGYPKARWLHRRDMIARYLSSDPHQRASQEDGFREEWNEPARDGEPAHELGD